MCLDKTSVEAQNSMTLAGAIRGAARLKGLYDGMRGARGMEGT